MPMQTESTPTSQPKPSPERRRLFTGKKHWWVGITLIAIFFLVLFFNSYFNIISNVDINPTGTTLTEKFYLSGPDPYYNMRLVDHTVQTGRYPYYSEKDPLLEYPIGESGGRGPLLVMSAIGFSKLLLPFMNESDALGYAMQFLPALFGALLIFPVYFIGKILFGRKAGLVAALLIAIIPIHISSGHGSAYGLFDHDSFNLFLFFLTFCFLIKSIKETDSKRSILYALLAGIPLAALSMVWVEAQFLYTVITVYAIVQLLIDIVTKKVEFRFVRSIAIALFAGYLISWPVTFTGGYLISLPIFLAAGVAVFGGICLLFEKKKIPWVITIPLIAVIGGVVALFLYIINGMSNLPSFLSPLLKISDILFGSGIYGNKVSLTIAEAGTSNMSRTVMSYGPALYWFAWAGFFFLIYQYVKQKGRKDYLLLIVLFAINIWLTSTAGRFLNDMVPIIAILAGWIIWFLISKVDYKQMARNIRNAGGGLRGIRKGVKVYHLIGVLFVAFLVFLPNGFLTLDAAVPSAVTKNGTSNMKYDIFGKNHTSAFGSSSYKEQYWVDAYSWLNNQDTNIANPAQRPAFISWWDYGFYEVAVGGHPAVADNFQDGIPPAANFHTAKSEKEGTAVWIVRLLEGHLKHNKGIFSSEVITTLQKHLGENNTNNITKWMTIRGSSPSYHTPIGANYDVELSKIMRVGEQYYDNAYYHDISQLLNDTLTDDAITWLYHDIQQATGYSIRYYGVEGYDEQIFNIFAFLGDKSNVLNALRIPGKKFNNPEDDFIQVKYVGYYIDPNTGEQGAEGEWNATELNTMSPEDLRLIQVTGTTTVYKEDYFNTMFYRTYIGGQPQQDEQGKLQPSQQQIPCAGLIHFAAEYITTQYPYQYGRVAVVIAKYYEGAFLNGSISCNNTPLQSSDVAIPRVALFDKYGIGHDYTFTDAQGNFSLIAPAGNITLQISYYSYSGELLLKYIIFNQTNNSLYSPITDDEAMRRPGAQYQRNFTITINQSTVEGFVYNDNNNNGSYEPAIDSPLSGVTVQLKDELFSNQVDPVVTNATGHYIFNNLYPSTYNLSAVENGFTLHSKSIGVEPDHLFYNVSKPKPAAMKGVVYYDADADKAYTTGEEISNVQVQLSYTKLDDTEMIIGSTTSDAKGSYSFSALVPGEYTLNATKQNSITGYLDYLTEQTTTLAANTTTWLNISLTYAPVTVSGNTLYGTTKVNDITITFAPDTSVENNTAKRVASTSDAAGSYVAQLTPGSYNISVDKREGLTQVYSFTGQLTLSVGQGVASYQIALIKHSVTVSGTTKYNTVGKANMTINFLRNETVINNTASDTSKISSTGGIYTVELTPGSYNVTIEELVNETGQNITYRFKGDITVNTGDTPRTLTIILTREESP
jgi:dolichyl-diphosphooligosaccharide--protein glycosyltransferase